MELKIDMIHVTVDSDDVDEDEIASEIQSHLEAAMDRILKEKPVWEPKTMEIEVLDLPPVDWESVTDKTGKLVEMILSELSAAV